jgi:sulfite reductase (NADPH) flavoprotein alpha-component
MSNLTLEPAPTGSEPPLTAAQTETFAQLAASVDRDQAIWLSGYFAGIAGATAALPAAGSLGAAPPQGAPAAVGSTAGTVTVLYASDTGNSKEIAGQLGELVRGKGREVQVVDVAKYKAKSLKGETELLLVVATHGEGDPPPSALDFFEFLEGRKAPKLPELKFSVLALGDSTYEHFCSAGRRVDERLEALGATRLLDRVDCDVDYEDDADAWTAAVVEELKSEGAAGAAPAAAAAPGSAPAASAFNKRNPFTAPVIDNFVLTGRGSTKETRHIEIDIEGSGLTYKPGDALGIVAENEDAVIAELLDTLDLHGDTKVTIKDEELPLADALRSKLEITAATPRFIEHWAEITEAAQLLELKNAGATPERAEFLHNNHVIDIVEAFPAPGIDAAQLIAGLRPLQPRLYSIASSLEAAPDEVHLTVSTVQYNLNGRPRTGVASGHLARLLDDDATVPVYISDNEHFHLPADDVPVVMIGAGTGVAPYRAFMQEREEAGASGKNWLFFGERNFRSDFLYQVEWQEQYANGLLTNLDLAFSRDQGEKVYVQDRVREQGKELYSWIEDGAVIYVCGDAEKMAPDVQAALTEVIAEHGGKSAEDADEYLTQLRRDDRFRLDVY